MGNHSRGQSVDSNYRTKAFSGKKPHACRHCPQHSPFLHNPHNVIWLLQQTCLMSMADDDYLHLLSRYQSQRSENTCTNNAASKSWLSTLGLSAPLSFVPSCSRGKQHLGVIQYFSLFQVQGYIKKSLAWGKQQHLAVMGTVLESDLESDLSSASCQLCTEPWANYPASLGPHCKTGNIIATLS